MRGWTSLSKFHCTVHAPSHDPPSDAAIPQTPFPGGGPYGPKPPESDFPGSSDTLPGQRALPGYECPPPPKDAVVFHAHTIYSA